MIEDGKRLYTKATYNTIELLSNGVVVGKRIAGIFLKSKLRVLQNKSQADLLPILQPRDYKWRWHKLQHKLQAWRLHLTLNLMEWERANHATNLMLHLTSSLEDNFGLCSYWILTSNNNQDESTNWSELHNIRENKIWSKFLRETCRYL